MQLQKKIAAFATLGLLLLMGAPMTSAVTDEVLVPWGTLWSYCQTDLQTGCEPSATQTGLAPFGGGDQSTCSDPRTAPRTNWDLHTTLGLRLTFTVPVTAKSITFHHRIDDEIYVQKITQAGNVEFYDGPARGNCDLAVYSPMVGVGVGQPLAAGEVVTLAVTTDDYHTHGMSYFDMSLTWRD